MFVRVKRSGPREYLQIVENFREGRKVRQRVIANLGRLDILRGTGALDSIATSLAQFSENVAVISSIKEGNQKVEWAKEWGSFLVFRRLWQKMELDQIIGCLKKRSKCEFDVERAIFYTVLHRLTEPGGDLKTSKWLDDLHDPEGVKIGYQHLLRAMGYLSHFKEQIEDAMFLKGRTLFDDSIDLVFFDTTSIYFEGEGPEGLAEYGHSKDHRPDRKQIIVGVVMTKEGDPICCEYWPGKVSDVKALLQIVEVLKGRFKIRRIILVCDKGMVSESNLEKLEKERIDFIVGVRLRNVKEVREEVLSTGGRYREVEDNLKVKEVFLGEKRYIICVNPEAARKDQKTREKILSDLEEKLRRGAKELIGNKGYRRYLKVEKGAVKIDEEKLKEEERFDGKFVLLTSLKTQNSGTQSQDPEFGLSCEEVAKSYKSLWEVEHAFRTLKDVLETRPIFHRKESHVKGHVFCSYLALCLLIALRKSLREHNRDKVLVWDDVIGDLRSFRVIKATFSGKTYLMRTEFKGTAHRCFQAVGLKAPPVMWKISSTKGEM
jgi:transposase